jgi:hypothetical protein
MITMGATQHQQPVAGVAWLVALDFASGMLRYTTAPVSITDGADTYLGVGALASVSAVTESEEVQADAITLRLSIVDTALIAASLGNVEGYRGRAATVYLQMLDATFRPVGPKVRRWAGLMDRVEIKRGNSDAGATGSIELRCSRSGIARMRNAQGLRLTHEQQLRRYPGDTGLRYVRTLIEQPTLWLSKRFQEQ